MFGEGDGTRILAECIDNPLLPVVYNVNAGHALPRCIILFGVDAVVDAGSQKIALGEGRLRENLKNSDYR